MKTVKKILLIVCIFFLVGIFSAFGYYFAVTKDVSLAPEKLTLNEHSVVIYDENNVPVKSAASLSLRKTVSIRNIPEHVKNAFISTEDKRFYKHNGFDVLRIARAVLNNVKARNFKEGASTISQQLIKNTHLSQEKTVKRKIREWKLTRQLEKSYSKDEILEKYLNSIYFGHSCFGITAASEFYFDKEPNELSVADSAILAGLVKSPNNYSPFKNPERCMQRKNVVLSAMLRNGAIDEAAKKAALDEPLPTPSATLQNAGYMHFVFDELTTLAETNEFKIGGRIEIGTNLDQNLQNELEILADEDVGCDKAMLVLDNTKHGFKACVSTLGNICRLPGSLIKPLLVYAPALEENILSPATPILDERVNYNGYSPENYDGRCHGYTSARECVEKSLNIPAVKVLESLGVSKGADYLEKLGLPVDKDEESLALALGGMKNGFTLRNLTAAYSALANGGIMNECTFISFVKINGTYVYKKTDSSRRVFSESSAYLMTDMLRGTAKNGTAKKLRSLPFDIAAKTGTVGTKNGNTDAYATSYTTRDCVSVWLGNADNSHIEYTGGGLPCNFLLRINEYLYERYQSASSSIPSFLQPKDIVRVTLDKNAYYDTHTLSLADDSAPVKYTITELFKKASIPLNKSDSFSNPSILTPDVILSEGKVIITFDRHSPTYYTYRIERYDYVTHTTLYEGELLENFIDDTIEKNKKYIYTVIPLYNGKEGKGITLPTVSTQEGDSPIPQDPILDKEWWEY